MGQDKGKGIANTDRSHGCRAEEKKHEINVVRLRTMIATAGQAHMCEKPEDIDDETNERTRTMNHTLSPISQDSQPYAMRRV